MSKPTTLQLLVGLVCLLLPTSIYFNTSAQPLFINEVMPKPLDDESDDCDQSMFNTLDPTCGNEWIELYNADPCNAIDLSCYMLGGKTANGNNGTFAFPDGATIEPLGFLVVGGANVASADYNLNDYIGTPNLCGPLRWFLDNANAWVGLYDPDGNVLDAVYWTLIPSSIEPAMLNSGSYFDFDPCVPAAACVNATTLAKPNQMAYNSEIFYVGQSPLIGQTFYRTVDGGTWDRNGIASPGICNDPTICPISDNIEIAFSATNADCGMTNGTASVNITAGNTPAITYEWSHDGTETGNSVSGLAPGAYSVSVTNGSGCTAIEDYVIGGTAGVNSTANNSGAVCAGTDVALMGNTTTTGTTITYTWTGPNSYMSTMQNPVLTGTTAAQSGTYTLVVNVDGCDSPPATTEVVISAAPPATASGGGIYCEGETINLNASTTATGTISYAWTGPATFSSALQNPAIPNSTAANSGTYELVITVDGCPSALTTTEVTVVPTVTGTVGSNSPICEGDDLNLTASTSISGTLMEYLWTGPGIDATNETLQNPTITGATSAGDAGVYSVIITVDGCPSMPLITNVSVINPDATASNDGSKCIGNDIQLMASTTATGTLIEYLWTGPGIDGSNNTDQNPLLTNVTVGDAGTYNVVVTIDGCVSPMASTMVEVTTEPDAMASNNGPVCEGGDLTLMANTTTTGTLIEYAWTGPGINASNEDLQSPLISGVTAAQTGVYSVIITVDGCASSPASTTVSLLTEPDASASSNSPICEGDALNLMGSTTTGGTTITYAWTGPNSFMSADQNPTIPAATAAADGVYTLIVTVDGCASQAVNTNVTVTPEPDATATNTGPTCIGNSITLNGSTTATGTVTYTWTGPNNFSAQNPTINNVTLADAGTYTLVVTADGCDAPPVTTEVMITTEPDATASNNGPVCDGNEVTLSANTSTAGTTITYLWSGPGAFTPSNTDPSPTVTVAGDYSVVISVDGCDSQPVMTTVSLLSEPDATASSNSPVCEGDDINLVGSTTTTGTTTTYLWTAPDGVTTYNTANPTISGATVSFAGTYTLVITVDGCDSQPITTAVMVNPIPDATASNDGPACEGEDIQLDVATAATGVTYTWTGPNTFSSALQNPILNSVTSADAGTYTVVVTSNGCDSPASTTEVSVSMPPDAMASNSGPVCEGEPVTLMSSTTATGTTITYAWTGPNTYTSSDQNPVIPAVTATETGNYAVIITVDGCASAPVSTNVTTTSPPFSPTTFTPDPICPGETPDDLIAAGMNITWYDDAALTSVVGTGSPFTPTIDNTTAGIYSFYATASNGGCESAPSQIDVEVLTPPASPANPINDAFCFGGSPGQMCVDNPGPGFFVSWYNAEMATSPVGAGACYTPPTPGSYWVEITQGNTGCVSERIEVTSTESPELTVASATGACNPDLLTYNMEVTVAGGSGNGYTLTADGLTVTGINPFTISNIPESTFATVTITDDAACSSAPIDLSPIDCDCPTVADPANPMGATICFGDPAVALTVDDPGTGFSPQWFTVATGGTPDGSGTSYIPSGAGTYYVEIEQDGSGCTSNRISVELIESPEIIISEIGSTCSADLTTYDIEISVSGGDGNFTVTATGSGTVNMAGDMVTGITAGENITINVEDGEGCTASLAITAPMCACPDVPEPTNPVPNTFCFGEMPTPLCVDAPPTGYTVAWYDALVGGTFLQNGNCYTPPTAGSYYAFLEEDGSMCLSDGIEVILTENPEIIISEIGSTCSADLTTYDVEISVSGGDGNFTVTATGSGTVNMAGDMVTGITAGENITINVTDGESCTASLAITAPMCACPDVPEPTNPINNAFCFGEMPTPLCVDAPPAGYTVAWYDALVGGTFLQNGNCYTPPTAGSYYAFLEEDGSMCLSDGIEVILTEHPEITISQNSSDCAADLLTYAITVTVAGGSGNFPTVTPSVGTITGTNPYTISGIPSGVALSIDVTDDNSCMTTVSFAALDCDCPDVPEPTNPMGNAFCNGDAPTELCVDTPPAGYTVEWYSDASAGSFLAAGNCYTPTVAEGAGTYFVQLVEDGSLCPSDRISVELTEHPEIVITSGASTCSADLTSYDLEITVTGGSGTYIVLGDNSTGVTPQGGDNFLAEGIPSDSDITIIAVDGVTSCEGTATFGPVSCDCPDVAEPTNPVNNTFCFGESPTELCVDVAPTGFILEWYNVASGGTVLSNDACFTPTIAGSYFVQLVENGSDCPSDRIEVILSENPEILINEVGSACAADLLTYDLEVSVSGGDGNLTITSPDGAVSGNMITGITAGQNATVNVSDGEDCTATATFTAPTCDCPDVAEPTNPVNNTFCFGEAPTELCVDAAPMGYSLAWYETASSTTILSTNACFTPTIAGSYFVQLIEDGSDCPSDRIEVILTENPEILITEVGTTCSADLSTYDFEYSVSGGDGSFSIMADVGTVDAPTNMVTGIAAGQAVTLTVTDGEGCTATATFTAPMCACPDVAEPTNPVPNAFCFGEMPTELCVDAPPVGYTVEWYDTPTLNNFLQNGNCYTPTSEGSYYAILVEDANACQSDAVEVILTEHPEIIIVQNSSDCAADLLTYEVNFSVTGGSESYPTVTNSTGIFADNGGGNYTISDINSGDPLTIDVTDSNGCMTSVSFAAIDCNCPDVPEPTNPVPNAFCFGATPTELCVDDPGAGFTVEWYGDAGNTSFLANGNCYTPTLEGIYFVQIVEDMSGCPSDRITVELTQHPEILITEVGTTCSTDLTTYDLEITVTGGDETFTIASSEGMVSGSTITGVASGNDVTIDVTDGNGCTASATFTAPMCDCPDVPAPTNPVSNAFCFGEMPTPLCVDAPPTGYTVAWYDALSGGAFLQNGNCYTPTSEGSYFAILVEDASGCESDAIEVILTEHSEIIITEASSVCNADLVTYQLNIIITGGDGNFTVVASDGDTPIEGEDGLFTINNVMAGLGNTINITVTDGNGCMATATFGPVECDCPDVAAPTNPIDNQYCFGESPTALSVDDPGAGYTVNWYDAPVGGILKGTGISFVPANSGTCFAEITENESGCVSDRIPVTLTQLPEIIITESSSECAADLLTYTLTVAASGGDENFDAVVSNGTVIQIPDNHFEISNIPEGQTVTITLTDGNGCSASATFGSVECDCPDVPAPTNPVGSAFCFGEMVTSVSVDDPGTGFTVAWYDALVGGTFFQNGNSFSPANAGTYYAEIVEDASGCQSERVAAEVIEYPEIIITQGTSTCSADLTTYDLNVNITGGTLDYTIVLSDGLIAVGTGNDFMIAGIASGATVSIDVTDANGCTASSILGPVDCNCAPVSPPSNPMDAEYCFGDPIPAILVDAAPTGFIINWYNAEFGGTLVGTGENFVPTMAGVYWAEMLETASDCPSTRVAAVLIEFSEIVITELGTTCSADLTTYSLDFAVSGDAPFLINVSDGTLASNGGGNYTLSGIPSGNDVTIDPTDANGCTSTATFTAPNCDCPAVPMPSNPMDGEYCLGAAVPVALSVDDPGLGYEVYWYDAPNAGTLQGIGTSIIPGFDECYWVEIVEEASLCPSERIEICSVLHTPINISEISSDCSVDLSTYTLVVQVSGGDAPYSVVASMGDAPSNNGGGQFTITGIPQNTSVNITATDDFGCFDTFSFGPVSCECPEVAAPTNPQDNIFCFGEAPTELCVDAPDAGFTIQWCDAAGTILGTGTCFTPVEAGSFFAKTVEDASGCESENVEVILEEIPEITILEETGTCANDLQTYNLDITISGGSGGYVFEIGGLVVQSNGGNSYTILEIDAGTSLNFTVTDGSGCSATAVLGPIDCDCPDVPEPTNPVDGFYCFDESPVAISVDNPTGDLSVEWYANSTGGTALAFGSNFTPTTAGTYYAQLVDDLSDCPSERIAVILEQGTAMTFTEMTNDCSPDLTLFDADIVIGGGTGPYVVVTENGLDVSGDGTGNFTVREIPANSPENLTITDANGCVIMATVGPESCDCPEVAAPTGVMNGFYCADDTPAVLSVDAVGAGLQVFWYNVPVGGMSVSTGATYDVGVSGTYYAEVHDVISDCVSERVPVILTEGEPIIVEQGESECSADLTTYNVQVLVSGGDGSYTFSTTAPSFLADTPSPGIYTLENIDSGTAASVTVTDGNGCNVTVDLTPIDCDCPVIPAPTNPVDNSYCFGEMPTQICIDTPPAGLTVNWHTTPTGFNWVGTGNCYTPSGPGTYYAEWVDGNGCQSIRIPVTLTQSTEVLLTEVSSDCADDLMSYTWTVFVSGYTDAYTATSTYPILSDDGMGTITIEVTAGNQGDLTITDDLGCATDFVLTMVDCDCPTIPVPTGAVSGFSCFGDPTDQVCVNNPGTGFSVNWYDDASGTILLGTGTCYTPTAAGCYFAEIVEDASSCASTLVQVCTVENPEITFVENSSDCSFDLTNYDIDILISGGEAPYTIDAAPYFAQNNGSGNFTILNIPSGSPATITVTDAAGCIAGPFELTTTTCDCNAIAPPSSPVGGEICFGDPIPSISVDHPGLGFLINWYDMPIGGTYLGSGISFTPSTFGCFYAEIEELSTDCTSDRVEVCIIEHSEIVIASISTDCSDDLLTYEHIVSVSGGTAPFDVSASTPFEPNNNGDGTYTFSAVPSGIPSSLIVTDGNGCTNQMDFAPINCDCPTIDPATNPVDDIFCFGETPGSICVDNPGIGFIVNWYTEAVGGSWVGSGACFLPLTPGCYWAEMVEDATDCVSSIRIEVCSQEAEAILLTDEGSACAADMLTYSQTFSISGGDGPYLVPITAFPNPDGSYTISNIPSGDPVSVTVTDANGCETTVEFGPVDCDCPAIPAPTNPVGAAICFGDVPVALSVDDPGVGFTVNWYADAVGGTSLGTSNTFTPSTTGCFYAEITEDASGCTSDRIEVCLTENSEISITDLGSTCAADNLTYTQSFSIAGGTAPYAIAVTAPYTVTEIVADSDFEVQNINSGEAISITVTDDNGCETTFDFALTDCDCAPIAAPTNPVGNEYCFGDAPSDICVDDPGVGFSIFWWSDAIGGSLEGLTPCFTPPVAGCYYAEIVEDATDCRSPRIEVCSIEHPEIVVADLGSACAADLLTYTQTFSISGGLAPFTIVATAPYTAMPTVPNSEFEITGITSGEQVSITVTDANGCETTFDFVALNCNCSVIAAPTNPIDADYCEFAPEPALCVDDPGVGFMIEWYSEMTGSLLLGTGACWTPDDAGTYYAQVTEVATGCPSDRVAVTLTALPSVASPAVASPVTYCEGEMVVAFNAISVGGTVTWYSDEDLTMVVATGNDFLPPTPLLGETNAYYATETLGDCESEATIVVISVIDCPCSNPDPPVIVTNQLTICEGDINGIPFEATSAPDTEINWYDAEIEGNLVGTGTTFVPTTPGIYYAEAIGIDDCPSDRVPFTLTEQPRPQVSVFPPIPASACVGDEVQFVFNGIAGPDAEFVWDFGDAGVLEGEGPWNMSWFTPGTQEVTLIVTQGVCADSTSFIIEISDLAVSTIEDMTIQQGQSVELTTVVTTILEGDFTYEWSTPETLDCPSCASPTATPTQTTTYEVLVADEYGCEATADVTLNLVYENLALFPNAFSPNEDGMNDIFRGTGKNVVQIEMQIFNRWGGLVYEGDGMGEGSNGGWDGTYKFRDVELGVYAWFAMVTFTDGSTEMYKGNVTVIR